MPTRQGKDFRDDINTPCILENLHRRWLRQLRVNWFYCRTLDKGHNISELLPEKALFYSGLRHGGRIFYNYGARPDRRAVFKEKAGDWRNYMVTREQRLQRKKANSLLSFLNKLDPKKYSVYKNIEEWEARDAEYTAPGQLKYRSTWRPIRLREIWDGETVLFRTTVRLTEEFSGLSVWLLFANQGESLAYVNGKPTGGLDLHHDRLLLSPRAVGDEQYEIVIESTIPRQKQEHGKNRGIEPLPLIFEKAALVSMDRKIETFLLDTELVFERSLLGNDPIIDELTFTILSEIRPEDPPPGFLQSAERLSLKIAETLEGRNGYPGDKNQLQDKLPVTITSVGHSHIDLAYLWPVKETVRKCARTFSSMLALMDEYPDFTFSQSQPYLYKLTKKYYPQVYNRIKERIKEGRWEVTGGMYIEPDCNIPGGESFVRQLLYGSRFIQKEFGHSTSVCWLPDTFGFCATLPQILVKAGFRSFYTTKLMANDTNEFPHNLFYWEGIDTSRILTVAGSFGAYSGSMEQEQIQYGIRTNHEMDRYSGLLYPYGHGDGGGGVTREMIEKQKRLPELGLTPELINGSVEGYFDSVHRSGPDLPVWKDELYFEYHRGVYTSQAGLKQLNRRCEETLKEAELLTVLSDKNNAETRKNLDEWWELVLINQFHDILTGSCIAEAAATAETELSQVLTEAEFFREGCLKRLFGGKGFEKRGTSDKHPGYLTVFNSLSFTRNGYVMLDTDSPVSVIDQISGAKIPAYPAERGKVLIKVENIPAFGFKSYRIVPQKGNDENSRDDQSDLTALRIKESPEEITIRNRYFTAVLNRVSGALTSLYDRKADREVLTGGGCDLELLNDVYTYNDAWNVHKETLERGQPLGGAVSARVTVQNPLQITIEMVRQFGNSRLKQRIRVYRDSRRIDFETWVDWKENGKLLKAAVYPRTDAEEAVYDIPFGTISRSVNPKNSREYAKHEVSGHKWADLSDGSYGVAVLNREKYGWDIRGNRMRLSLLKSSNFPDPDSDRREHHFTYSIFPHPGDWKIAEIDKEALAVNTPLLSFREKKRSLPQNSAASASAFSLNGTGVYVSAVKPAADGSGDTVVRIHEYHGSTADIRLELYFVKIESLWECDLLEEPLEQDGQPLKTDGSSVSVTLKPYEIKTLRIAGKLQKGWNRTKEKNHHAE